MPRHHLFGLEPVTRGTRTPQGGATATQSATGSALDRAAQTSADAALGQQSIPGFGDRTPFTLTPAPSSEPFVAERYREQIERNRNGTGAGSADVSSGGLSLGGAGGGLPPSLESLGSPSSSSATATAPLPGEIQPGILGTQVGTLRALGRRMRPVESGALASLAGRVY